MSAAASIRAAAALELRRRLAAGSDRVGVLVKSFDGNGWRWRGERISDDEAAVIRRTWRGKMITVHRSPAPLPAREA